MSLDHAAILFLTFTLGYMAMSEVFIVLFRLTGLPEEKARFQVISMLTNSGFTTNESELITTSRTRRKLARMTMIFGYTFTVTIVSSIVNMFLSMAETRVLDVVQTALLFVGIFILGVIVRRVSIIKISFDNVVKDIGRKFIFGKKSNPMVILDSYHSSVIAELVVTDLPECLRGVSLMESGVAQKCHLQVMVITRGGVVNSDVKPTDTIEVGDKVVVFGPAKAIRILFKKIDTSV